MKNIFLIVIALIAILSHFVQASNGNIQFYGVVSSATCNVEVLHSGAAKDVVQLGVVKPQATGNETTFTIKAVNPSDASCTNLPTTAVVSWASTQLNSEGIGKEAGSATNSVVLLTAKNSTTANTPITKNSTSAEFTANNVVSNGFEFGAKLKAGTQPGDMQASAAFVIVYK